MSKIKELLVSGAIMATGVCVQQLVYKQCDAYIDEALTESDTKFYTRLSGVLITGTLAGIGAMAATAIGVTLINDKINGSDE